MDEEITVEVEAVDKRVARYLFSEAPYAAALYTSQLRRRCSNCFADVSGENGAQIELVDCDCEMVYYCSQLCKTSDQPLHKFECDAVKQKKKRGRPNVDLTVRFIGRMFARRTLRGDDGRYCMDFPSHLVQGRVLSQLMQHRAEISNSPRHQQLRDESEASYYDFFYGSVLDKATRPMWYDAFCQYVINGFAVNIRLRPEPGLIEVVGDALYLNVSMFDHSCTPTCIYRFEGTRLVMFHLSKEMPDDVLDDPETFMRRPFKLTRERFDTFKLHYGIGSSYTFGTACPLTYQRQRSLAERYFFHCQCELCSNTLRTTIQMDSAPIECSKCSAPYVWSKGRLLGEMRLKESCKCPDKGKKTKEQEMQSVSWWNEDHLNKNYKELLAKWEPTMELAYQGKNFKEILETCLTVRESAEKYWNNTFNLRYGQLNEKILDAICSLTPMQNDQPPPGMTLDDLNMAIKAGENALRVYFNYFSLHMLSVANLASDMGRMYKIRGLNDDAQKSRYWYGFAADVWKRRGELECAKFVEMQAQAPAPWTLNE